MSVNVMTFVNLGKIEKMDNLDMATTDTTQSTPRFEHIIAVAVSNALTS